MRAYPDHRPSVELLESTHLFPGVYTIKAIGRSVAILKKAYDNGDLTRDGLFKAFESLQQVDLGGLYPPVTYGGSPDQRVPTRDNSVYAIDHTSPGGVKDLSGDFVGTAAKDSKF